MNTMTPDRPFGLASWYRASTLVERADLLRSAAGASPASSVDTAAAQRRLERWRAQAPFGDETLFQRRLTMDGLTESLFQRILSEPIENVVSESPGRVRWLDTLEKALSLPRSDGSLLVPPKFAKVPTSGFLEIARPLIDEARGRLRDSALALTSGVSDPLFNPATVDALLAPSMAEPMLRMLMRTMVLEMNVAKVQGLLSGETPGDRFNDFIHHLRRPDVGLGIFLEYPVLARHLVRRAEQWFETGRELLSHLITDGPALRAMFGGGEDFGPLVGFDGGTGDAHRDGRAVGIATFRSGLKLVYKPKPLAVENHFQELLVWLNEHGADPPFRILKVLDRGDHGWMEFVKHEPCTSVAEVERFYARQGENLALLYALGATDFHFENLIAAGEHPVLVDLETLFHPLLADEYAPSLATKESLFRTNLLPLRMSAGGDYAGMDISGLGSPDGQLTPNKVQDWDDSFQDSMRFIRRRVRMRGGDNQPVLQSTPVEVTRHLGALRAGFDAMYSLLSRHRDALLAAGGPLERFAHDEMRVVMRDTRSYLILLGEVFHPDALRDALDQDCLLDHLWASVARLPHLAKLVESERASLARYDVPLFAIEPSSTEVTSDTGARIPGLVAISGLDRTAWRLRGLDARTHVRQRWCIDAGFASVGDGEPAQSLLADGRGGRSAPLGEAVLGDRPLRERLLDAARAVADRLATLAYVDGEVASWNILRQVDERYWSIASTGIDLYGGFPGIALFLSHLGRLTGEDHHRALATRCVSTMRSAIEHARKVWKPIGAFEGWGGVIYGLCGLASALDDRSLVADAESIVEILPPLIEQDENLDVISGAAGCILGLLCLHRVAPSPRTLLAAVACGERLLARGQAMEHGIGWRTPIAPVQPLCGLSHGASGISWALLELSAVTSDLRFRAAGEQAFRYERSQRSPDGRTWQDLRKPTAESNEPAPAAPQHPTTAWCHGAAGIGLVRTRALAHIDNPELREQLREEFAQAVAATVRGGFGHNHSLCHGDLGNLELLLQASADPSDTSARPELDRLQVEILESIARNGFRCATPGSVDTPGLMLGLAGIGYGLLRLVDSERVPSVLLLQGPNDAERTR